MDSVHQSLGGITAMVLFSCGSDIFENFDICGIFQNYKILSNW